ncbi:MAG: hypothetical protein KGI59_00575 [Patescibacteria group bacterium]|nr:hypothetical protein [Patescibacteria group bacterium]MDE2172408.1 hypothetical protein [Patescibacteria group bacterium]
MTNESPLGLPKHIHFIGISGVATSALAIAFHERGVRITGSDRGFFPPASTELERHAIPFYAGWHADKMIELGAPDAVMIGNASGSQNPETLAARNMGIPTYSYPQLIDKYFVRKHSIVCAGTWGKTSSTALLSAILGHAGYDPSYMFGGISLSHDAAAHIGDSSWSVLEGDEYRTSPTDSRAKFSYYRPTELLLTAVSWDHADMYPTEESYFEAFEKLVSNMPAHGLIVACADNRGVESVIGSFKGRVIRYGRARPQKGSIDYEYRNVAISSGGLSFTIAHHGKEYAIASCLLGLYQVENICGCFALANESGVPAEKIIEAISSFKGLKRRMEKRLDGQATSAGVTVIDDIAHSPEKASSVLATLRSIYEGKIIAVFEPNIGGRRPEALTKYEKAFSAADMVIIPRLTKLKIADGELEAPIEGSELARVIGATHGDTRYIDDDAALVGYLKAQAQSGDVIAFLGSHGFRGMIEGVVKLYEP